MSSVVHSVYTFEWSENCFVWTSKINWDDKMSSLHCLHLWYLHGIITWTGPMVLLPWRCIVCYCFPSCQNCVSRTLLENVALSSSDGLICSSSIYCECVPSISKHALLRVLYTSWCIVMVPSVLQSGKARELAMWHIQHGARIISGLVPIPQWKTGSTEPGAQWKVATTEVRGRIVSKCSASKLWRVQTSVETKGSKGVLP